MRSPSTAVQQTDLSHCWCRQTFHPPQDSGPCVSACLGAACWTSPGTCWSPSPRCCAPPGCCLGWRSWWWWWPWPGRWRTQDCQSGEADRGSGCSDCSSCSARQTAGSWGCGTSSCSRQWRWWRGWGGGWWGWRRGLCRPLPPPPCSGGWGRWPAGPPARSEWSSWDLINSNYRALVWGNFDCI